MANQYYVVIGYNTTVTFDLGDCVTSVQWGFNPNIQRLWCLNGQGIDSIYTEYFKPTETASVTAYSPGVSWATTPTMVCDDADRTGMSVSPAICPTGAVAGVTGQWFVTSYSYSKEDRALPGQETWQLQKWPDAAAAATYGLDANKVAEPAYIMAGIAEGQASDNDGSVTGIVFSQVDAQATQGSVQAGAFGRASVMNHGRVSSVGGGSATAGDVGNGSASIPHTPLYNV